MNLSENKCLPVMEFHISRQARDRYHFDDSLFAISGNVIFANFHAARSFAQKMNAQTDLVRYPDRVVKAGQINALGLIDEILHLIINLYRTQVNPQLWEKALKWLSAEIGGTAVEGTIYQFSDEFPPLQVYRQETHLKDYLSGENEGIPNKQIALEELLLLWLANKNTAFSPFLELFNDHSLENNTAYLELISSLGKFLDTQPGFGPKGEPLLKILRAPALASPHSLFDQLQFLLREWSTQLGGLLPQLLSSLDFIREEEKPVFMGPGPSRVYKFTGKEFQEEERFSPDLDWMPRLVMLAKNAYVWLDQLSKEYNQPIKKLDQVPDAELDKLARWGFTGLWLIGIWERSPSSEHIKKMCGNPDAVASAYSLYDYVIADRLGGEEALNNLRYRAWERGIRLGADMVPNHVGIYSKWIIEHPDWFISLDYSPFPPYSFNGQNLSEDDRVGIYLEDHYYSRDDAAVVFKRVDHWTGDVKYVYHGNDGTSMPWNDTAQLDYLKAEVREAAIQTILHVARKFPVIRFDAAMTLAKKHFHRLWYPEPGTGGDIPSRSGYGISKTEFDQAMPIEFWREVVDRVALEVPDTLLLAEAFWMMEGYFVRTLGMHRVYNSAFMNMLRDEKNDQYRKLIKNTLEFDPEILKRYVNFMNNPDEKTAVEQFGKDDKYFGICTMMATMPGLPMFGHGQIEGYHEKYGMEYYRAYWEEQPDAYLINRHEREIFPLLHRRYLFAEVENFFLYDFYTSDGVVEENIFAYSNRIGQPGTANIQRALIIFHNRWADVKGWINLSAAFKDKHKDDDEYSQIFLGNGLGLQDNENYYTIFRDQVTGLEFIRNNREIFEKGLYLELGAYKYHVFIDFKEVVENEWHQYARLAEFLNGRGTPNIEDVLNEILLQPIHYPFKEIINPEFIQWLIDNRIKSQYPIPDQFQNAIEEVEAKLVYFFEGINEFSEEPLDSDEQIQEILWKLRAALTLPVLLEKYPLPRSRIYKNAYKIINFGADEIYSLEEGDILSWCIIIGWLFTHNLGNIFTQTEQEERSRRLVDEWLLNKIIANTLQQLGFDLNASWKAVNRIKILIKFQNWFKIPPPKRTRALRILKTWLADPDVQQFLKINTYQDTIWFNKEAMEDLLRWMLTIHTLSVLVNEDMNGLRKSDESVTTDILNAFADIRKIMKASKNSEYKVENLLMNLS
jgi:glycosidase